MFTTEFTTEIAFIRLIEKIQKENIPFELTTKAPHKGVNKAFITFPFMEGDIALLAFDLWKAEPDIQIESYNTPWDSEGDITTWIPEEEELDKLVQNIKMFWKGYNATR